MEHSNWLEDHIEGVENQYTTFLIEIHTSRKISKTATTAAQFVVKMNINNFRECMEDMSHMCHRLTPEQFALIENSLIMLQSENKMRDIFFLGRIEAIDFDYYIAFGYSTDCLLSRQFFWSQNGFKWFLVPQPKEELVKICHLCTSKFQGDPSMITAISVPEMACDGADEIYDTRKTVHLKEEDRLACVISMICNEAAIVPRGAIYKRVNDAIIYNPLFRGLSKNEAKDFLNFQLCRAPCCKWNSNLLKRKDYNFATDFMDTLDAVIPEESSFSKIIDELQRIVYIRSLQWPGMFFFHRLDTSKHGFVYFGDGKKNFDILFMLH